MQCPNMNSCTNVCVCIFEGTMMHLWVVNLYKNGEIHGLSVYCSRKFKVLSFSVSNVAS